jgi:hypothetical protein
MPIVEGQGLSTGIYERLVTNELQRRLEELDAALVDRTVLHPVDAHEILSRHLATIIRRALGSIPGDNPAALGRKVALADQIAEAIIAIAPEVDGDL